jgi:hypothetical protein
MSKVFKYLDIDNHELISEKLYHYVLEHTDILENKIYWNTLNVEHVLKHVPELGQAVSQVIPARMFMIAIFYTPAGFAGGVHIDANVLDYRVLWPVHNCKGSYTKFFDLNGNRIVEMFTKGNDPYLAAEEKYPLIEIASAETIAPLVLHVKTPHGIYTNPENSGPRLTATMGFDYPLENFLK